MCGNFSFTATAECYRCGKYLSSSDEECPACADQPLRRYHFEHVADDRIQTVWAINPIRAWDSLHDQHVDSVIGWRLMETGKMGIHLARLGYDVTDRDQLRTP